MNEPVLKFVDVNGKNYPQWNEYGLFDIGKTNSNENLSEKYAPDTLIPFYKVSDMNISGNEKIMHTAKTYITKAFQSARNIKIYYQDAIIFAKRGAALFLDRKRIAMKPFSIDSNMMGFFPAKYVNLDFLYYWFCTRRLSDYAQDGTLPALNSYNIESIIILLPTQKEQQKIADFLSTVDEKIALKQKKYDALIEAKKGLLQKIFSREIRFRKDDGGEYPEWTSVALGDIANLYNGYAFKSSTYDASGQYNIITIANVTGDKYVSLDDKTNKISILPDNIATHQILKPNDILISMTGNVGRVSLNTGNHNLLNQRVGLLRTTESNSYVYYAIANDMFRNAMVEKGQGGAQPNIKKDDILDYEIQLPCKCEQQKIDEFLSSFDEKIEAVKKELEGWKAIKKGLLQQMFC